MRVIAGQAKGHPLRAPKGAHTRPTSDLVRGAIFSMLESLAVDWSRVLDLYAGTGALGIEALSRGAGWVDFVEQDRGACAIIKENLLKTGFSAQAHVYCSSVRRAMGFLEGPYTLVVLDPPYNDPALLPMLAELGASPWVKPGTTIVIEHGKRVAPAPVLGTFRSIKTRRHGDTCISVYQ